MKWFQAVVAFLHRHPIVKSTAVAAGGALVMAASQGEFGSKYASVAGAVIAVAGLWTKRPVDATPAEKAGRPEPAAEIVTVLALPVVQPLPLKSPTRPALPDDLHSRNERAKRGER